MKKALTDNCPMPWGKFKGTKMANVPGTYLLWLVDVYTGVVSDDVKNYVNDNRDALKLESNNANGR